MVLRACSMYLYIYMLLLNFYSVRGLELNTNEEDVLIRKQLKILNKPAVVAAIQTIYGDTYNCVDFYKQPAFEHPLMKNHSFYYQMKPSSYSKERGRNDSFSNQFYKIWLNGKGCPNGTVPIKKITKDDIIKANKISKIYRSKRAQGVHVAGLRTMPLPDTKFTGGAMVTSLHNPKVLALQYSGSRLHIEGGSDFIQVGWMVNPNLYPDERTRSFVFTRTNELYCFNMLCPGFVLTRSDLPIDSVFNQIYHKVIHFYIFKDSGGDGNWWLAVGPNKINIGFWPERIFTGLAKFATSIEWGGEVYSPPGIPSPIMGNGPITSMDPLFTANCYKLEYIDEGNQFVQAQNLKFNIDNDVAYDVRDRGVDGGGLARYFIYGGQGGIIEI